MLCRCFLLLLFFVLGQLHFVAANFAEDVVGFGFNFLVQVWAFLVDAVVGQVDLPPCNESGRRPEVFNPVDGTSLVLIVLDVCVHQFALGRVEAEIPAFRWDRHLERAEVTR